MVLCGRESGIEEAAGRHNCVHLPHVATSASGIPILSEVLRLARLQFPADVYVYVNADIILLDDFAPALQKLWQQQLPFLGTARRMNVELTEALDFSGPWIEEVGRLVDDRAVFTPLWCAGGDVLAFTNQLLRDVPPFIVGRWHWDHWMMHRALEERAALVDLSPSVRVVHQEHHYEHIVGGGRQPPRAFWSKTYNNEDVRKNEVLSERKFANVLDATHSLRNLAVVGHAGHQLGLLYSVLRSYGVLRRKAEALKWRNSYTWMVFSRASHLKSWIGSKIPVLKTVNRRIRRILARLLLSE